MTRKHVLIVIGLLILAATQAVAQTQEQEVLKDPGATVDQIFGFVTTTLLFLIGGLFVWVWIFGLFLLRIDGSGLREPNDNFATDTVAVMGSTLFYGVFGFKLMYPGDGWVFFGVLGSLFSPTVLEPVGLAGTRANLDYASVASDFFFQSSFAAAVCALFVFSFSGRISGIRLIVASVLVTGFVWPIAASWQWGGGFLGEMGFLDFSGATICFFFVGVFSLLSSIAVGPRSANFDMASGRVREPASYRGFAAAATPLLSIGTAFGICGASHLAFGTAGDAADVSRIVSNVMFGAGMAAMVSWVLLRFFPLQQPEPKRLSGEATAIAHGVLAGTFALSAEPLAPSFLVVGIVCITAVLAQNLIASRLRRFRIDDPVGAISAGIGGGAIGTVMAVFSNGDATLTTQLVGLTAIGLFSAIAGFVLHIDLFLRRQRQGSSGSIETKVE